MSARATSEGLVSGAPRSGALFDASVAAAAAAGSLVLLSHGGIGPYRPGSRELDLLGAFLAACSTVPLVARRRFPFGVFVATATAGVFLAGLGYRVDLMLGPTAALYLFAASREEENPWTPRTTGPVIGLFVAYLGAAAAAHGVFPGFELLHTGLAWAVAWFAGERARLRREHIAELSERAIRLERETQRERLLATAEERARMARDLHDSAGHAVNVIAIRAGAARLRHHEDPDRSRAALEAIEELARETAQEIDQIVGTLRDGSPNGAVEPPPGLASLNTLISQRHAAGLEVTLDTTGTPRPLCAAADRAVYRIIQEALTNATRHGAGHAHIELGFSDGAVEVMITNPVAVGGSSRSGGGHGLIGMRERATLLGGSFDVERVDGTFRVCARIPYGRDRA